MKGSRIPARYRNLNLQKCERYVAKCSKKSCLCKFHNGSVLFVHSFSAFPGTKYCSCIISTILPTYCLLANSHFQTFLHGQFNCKALPQVPSWQNLFSPIRKGETKVSPKQLSCLFSSILNCVFGIGILSCPISCAVIYNCIAVFCAVCCLTVKILKELHSVFV